MSISASANAELGSPIQTLSAVSEPPIANPYQQLSAAKLQVMHLDSIKERLGPKWEKLAELVHKLFEKAIREAIGPGDHFIRLDEMSYAVTFRELSLTQATAMCTAIAQQVCEKLFGGSGAEIMVRALVGKLSHEILAGHFHDDNQISALLVLNGKEIMVRSAAEGAANAEADASTIVSQPLGTIHRARDKLLPLDLELGFFPVWDLERGRSSSVHISAYAAHGRRKISCTRQLLSGYADRVVDAEITLLHTAHAYAHRVRAAGKVCAVGAGVSYETLAQLASRNRYVAALRCLSPLPECPILLKVENIPPGIPLGSLAQFISLLAIPNMRFTLQFQSREALPARINIRLGAIGIGCPVPHGFDNKKVGALIKTLNDVFAEQKGFTFLEDLDTVALVMAALVGGVRFGAGFGISTAWLTGAENVPHFPLTWTDLVD
jgi:hypothetical protein